MLTFLTQAPYWEWPMGPWHMGWSGGGFWWFFPMLMFVFMIVLCVFLMGRMHWHSHDHSRSALELLAERYAKGEINKEEFEQKRAVIARR